MPTAHTTVPAAAAESPKGGKTVCAVVLSDPDKGKFALKDKDAAMAAAFDFLRSKGAFPEDNVAPPAASAAAAPPPPHTQPNATHLDAGTAQVHSMLEQAARLHQDGELEKAVR